MREEKRTVSIAQVLNMGVELPGTPHSMWESGELWDFLDIPDDGTRVEIIDGIIVVSPAPRYRHNAVIGQIADLMAMRRVSEPSYPWRCIQNNGLSFISVGDGYIPDLIVLSVENHNAAFEADIRNLATDQVELVVEVTSPSNAAQDRPPTGEGRRGKWVGYARAEVPYYLLVDEDPKDPKATLYSIPDQRAAAYLHKESWAFGETIVLPDPFGVEILTDQWRPWT